MATSVAASSSALRPAVGQRVWSKRFSGDRRALAKAPAPAARGARRNVTVRAVEEVAGADFKAEVLDVSARAHTSSFLSSRPLGPIQSFPLRGAYLDGEEKNFFCA